MRWMSRSYFIRGRSQVIGTIANSIGEHRSFILDRQRSSKADRLSRFWNDRKLGKLSIKTEESIAALDLAKLKSLAIAIAVGFVTQRAFLLLNMMNL